MLKIQEAQGVLETELERMKTRIGSLSPLTGRGRIVCQAPEYIAAELETTTTYIPNNTTIHDYIMDFVDCHIPMACLSLVGTYDVYETHPHYVEIPRYMLHHRDFHSYIMRGERQISYQAQPCLIDEYDEIAKSFGLDYRLAESTLLEEALTTTRIYSICLPDETQASVAKLAFTQ